MNTNVLNKKNRVGWFRQPGAIRKIGHEAVWLVLTVGLVSGPAFAEEKKNDLEALLGKDGRLRSPIITIGNYVVWLFIVVGAIVFMKGVWDVMQEWQKGDNERKEWRKPMAQMLIGGGIAGALIVWKAVATTVSGTEAVNPFSAG